MRDNVTSGVPEFIYSTWDGLKDWLSFLANIEDAELLYRRKHALDQHKDFSVCSDSKVSSATLLQLIFCNKFEEWVWVWRGPGGNNGHGDGNRMCILKLPHYDICRCQSIDVI